MPGGCSARGSRLGRRSPTSFFDATAPTTGRSSVGSRSPSRACRCAVCWQDLGKHHRGTTGQTAPGVRRPAPGGADCGLRAWFTPRGSGGSSPSPPMTVGPAAASDRLCLEIFSTSLPRPRRRCGHANPRRTTTGVLRPRQRAERSVPALPAADRSRRLVRPERARLPALLQPRRRPHPHTARLPGLAPARGVVR
jgi:hypothetical protein